jgi:hypothetical protein
MQHLHHSGAAFGFAVGDGVVDEGAVYVQIVT